MQYKFAFSIVSVALLVLILGPSSSFAQKGKNKGFGGQGGGGFGGGPGGGGKGNGGFGGNPFGGGGFGGGFGGIGGGFGPKNAGMGGLGATDPSALFDQLAQGRPYFMASESGRLAGALTTYLASKGNNSGQVTRDVFVSFYGEMSGAMGRGFPGQGKNNMMAGGFGGFQGGNPLSNMTALAESEFKFYDTNGDGVLNIDEMPPQLRAELSQWDKDHNNLITLDEYVQYYGNRMLNRNRGGQFNPVNIMIIEEDDIDTRPTVYRGGKLPTSGLPPWFRDLANKDGQVTLYAWYKDNKEIDDFKEWDRNDDGFITVEEAMARQRALTLSSGEDDEDGYPTRGAKGDKGGMKGKGKGKGAKGDKAAGGFGGFGGGDFSDFGGGKGKGGKGGGKGGKGGKGAGGGFGGFGAGMDEETAAKFRDFMSKKKAQSDE